MLREMFKGPRLCAALLLGLSMPCSAQKTANQAAVDASGGWLAFETGRLQEAKTLMLRAVAEAPKHADYQAALGIIELKAGEQEKGIRSLRTAIALQPLNAEYRLRLAETYQVQGKDLEVIKLLQLANVGPDLKASWHFTRGFSLFRLGQFHDAKNELTPLTESPQFSAPANFFLGNVAFSENNFTDAARFYEVAVRSGNTDANVAFNAYLYDYGLALFRLGKYAEAEEQFRASVVRYENDPLPWMYTGRCEQELGNYRAAIDMLERSIQVDPKFGLAYYELARLQKKYGDPARAAQLFDAIASMKQEEIKAEESRAENLKIGGVKH